MKIIRLTKNSIMEYEGSSAVAIGKFDGIHTGHRSLLQRLLLYKQKGLCTVVFSFEKSITAFLKGQKDVVIATEEEKIELLSDMGIDYLALYPVNEESISIEAEEFIENILVKQLKAKAIVAGEDCSFGRYGKGDGRLLLEKSAEFGYEFECVPKVREEYEGRVREISSTYIREEILNGHMEHVNSLLGRHYSFNGVVVSGNQIGRTIDMPTANIKVSEGKILPPMGVYLSRIYVRKNVYAGISNLGRKPTIKQDEDVNLETYIYDFDEDIYSENIKVELLAFIRPEQKFESLEKLKAQLFRDKENGRKLYQERSSSFFFQTPNL